MKSFNEKCECAPITGQPVLCGIELSHYKSDLAKHFRVPAYADEMSHIMCDMRARRLRLFNVATEAHRFNNVRCEEIVRKFCFKAFHLKKQ